MINKKSVILTALILFSMPVYANDRAIEGIGGTFHVLKGEHPSISMEYEKISMDIYPEYYNVKVNFIFKNYSKSPVTVKMGFPENAYGAINSQALKNKSSFLTFKTMVNGKPAKVAKREVTQAAEGSFSSHWLKEVTFAPLQTLNVQTEYRSKTGMSAVPSIYVEYEFTGSNWKGKVKESDLVVTSHLPKDYSLINDEYTPKDIVKKDNKIYFNRKNWEADSRFTLEFKKGK